VECVAQEKTVGGGVRTLIDRAAESIGCLPLSEGAYLLWVSKVRQSSP